MKPERADRDEDDECYYQKRQRVVRSVVDEWVVQETRETYRSRGRRRCGRRLKEVHIVRGAGAKVIVSYCRKLGNARGLPVVQPLVATAAVATLLVANLATVAATAVAARLEALLAVAACQKDVSLKFSTSNAGSKDAPWPP